MKYEFLEVPPKVTVLQMKEVLSLPESAHVISLIQKSINSGKDKIIIEFNDKTAPSADTGLNFFDRKLETLRQLAKKTEGGIRLVAPPKYNDRASEVFPTLEAALKEIITSQANFVSHYQTMWVQVDDQAKRLEKVTAVNQVLAQKLQQLLEVVRQPSTDAELKAALEHYRILAAEAENRPPGAAAPETEKKAPPATPAPAETPPKK